jgi:hypothetical protein
VIHLRFSVKIASPNLVVLRIVDPSVSLESVVFLLPGVGARPQTLRLPAAKMQNDKKFRIDTFGDETYALRACLRDRPNSSPILRSFVLPVLAKAIMNH